MWLNTALAVAIISGSLVEASLRPRGVPQQNLSQYRPDKPFTCFDKSKTYSFDYVNDDYCDCPDGSDEPGTSACPNGRFFCPNVGHKGKYISSMFVDDGVCDCCDGSDEQINRGSQSPCANTCDALGKIAREEAERKRQAMEAGHSTYKDYVQKYQQEIGDKREKLKQIETDRTNADSEKQRLQKSKEEIEKLENEAKDLHSKAWEETKKQILDERARKAADEAFNELDVNKDGFVALGEIQSHLEFDVDGDGLVSDDEAREHLEDAVPADKAHFLEKVWPHIKDIYRKPGSEPPTPATEAPTTTEIPSLPDEEEDEAEERLAEERVAEMTRKPHRSVWPRDEHKDAEDEELKMPEYPEETKKLIEAGDQARSAYENARKSYDDIDRDYNELVSVTSTDFGANGEFYALRGECFEIEDREYIYKLCPFDRSAQKQKHGHHETNLGRFEGWKAEGDNKYAHQMYTHGESCWNGPARSVQVRIGCGGENKITTVTEPSRCEYAMDFLTPAACNIPPPPVDHLLTHDDL